MSLMMCVSTFRRRMRSESERGSAALEFAFIAPIFFALMLGILEIGVMTFGQFALQNAVTQAGRLIRTGQAQAINPTTASQCVNNTVPGNYATSEDWFRGQICCNVSSASFQEELRRRSSLRSAASILPTRGFRMGTNGPEGLPSVTPMSSRTEKRDSSRWKG